MWFNVDFDLLVLDNLPDIKRKMLLFNYVRELVKPIKKLHYNWQQFRNENIYKLNHTGQICYLRSSLNDKFDPVQRRIYIGEGSFYETTYLYTESEAQDVDAHTQQEPQTLWLRTDAETADTGLDFIVWVPEQIITTQIHGLRAHVDTYRAGGKRYNIFAIQ